MLRVPMQFGGNAYYRIKRELIGTRSVPYCGNLPWPIRRVTRYKPIRHFLGNPGGRALPPQQPRPRIPGSALRRFRLAASAARPPVFGREGGIAAIHPAPRSPLPAGCARLARRRYRFR